MPGSPPDSSDSPPPSATPFPDRGALPGPRTGEGSTAWRINAWLFLATVASAFVTYLFLWADPGDGARSSVIHAAQFTGALLSILLAHEFGHFIAARIHRVDA